MELKECESRFTRVRVEFIVSGGLITAEVSLFPILEMRVSDLSMFKQSQEQGDTVGF